ncbi:phosphate acyltransferase PlsX [Metallumcola ferriviriculae]|uniref:Phosphate acyltransferase n=1 Tax=Metallumcola ferriviriculae TaxID=3039180 RepID=A0AAU0UNS4_9FIRM|nr:phosphate acyltransferase PlsX [Desulfitibacteraceae bacterium MK1]
MRIAVDAMGGDNAPEEIVAGALLARNELGYDITLVGDEQRMRELLPSDTDIEIRHATEIIHMDEAPAVAVRRKKDASIVVATKLVKDGYAEAIVSAGSTGAQMTAALFDLGRIKGIKRPAISTLFPTAKGPKVLLDSGANADSKPENLVQFAHMGCIYAEKVLGMENPTVGLLNIGSEEGKGNELTVETYQLLKNESLNFIGNVEPRDITIGNVDVMVCDGFVGNIVLKLAEGLGTFLMNAIKDQLTSTYRYKIGAAMVAPGIRNIKKLMDYSEYGGAPLLGVDGVSIISHGSSDAKAIKNAIKAAGVCVNNGFVASTKSRLRGEDK